MLSQTLNVNGPRGHVPGGAGSIHGDPDIRSNIEGGVDGDIATFAMVLKACAHLAEGMRRGLCSERSITSTALPATWVSSAARLSRWSGHALSGIGNPPVLLSRHFIGADD